MARKIKIYIYDPESNKKLNLPSFHLRFLNLLISIALRSKSLWIKSITNPNQLRFLKNINPKDFNHILREVRKELKDYDSFDLVNISSSEGVLVKITII